MLHTIVKDNIVTKPLADRRISLSWLLASSTARGATDPRDKVFALHGFFQAMQVPVPLPDYAKSVQQVYLETACAVLSWDSNLDLLYQVTESKNISGLPSWVPDFSNTLHARFMPHLSYNATKDSRCSWKASGNTLSVYGYAVDTVRECAPVMDDSFIAGAHDGAKLSSSPADMASDAWYDILKQWSKLASSLSKYPTNEPVKGPFAATLLMDHLVSLPFEMEVFYDVFKSWHATLARSSSRAAFDDRDISRMLNDVAAMPPIPSEKREFAGQMVASLISRYVRAIKFGPPTQQIICLHYWLALAHLRKALFVTMGNWMGMVPAMAQKGDVVVLLSGLRTPFVLRELGDGTAKLLGPAYVHGMMNGALWDGKRQLQEFKLV